MDIIIMSLRIVVVIQIIMKITLASPIRHGIPDHTEFGLVMESKANYLSPYNDTDVSEAHDILSDELFETILCEDLQRGETFYQKNNTPWKNYTNVWCHYKPTHAYLARKKVKIFQSDNGNYPPRKFINMCKFPDWPCYKDNQQSSFKSDRLWCPKYRCTHQYLVSDSQYLWIDLNGTWKKKWVVIKYPWYCGCNKIRNKRCKT